MTDIVVFDTSFLLPVFSRNLPAPEDPLTRKPIDRYYGRIDHLLNQLEAGYAKVLIPTPVLSEFLVKVETGQVGKYLGMIYSRSTFLDVPFEQEAAIKLATMTSKAVKQGDKFGGSTEPWQKVKFDRQIVAIAGVNRAKIVYSDDRGLRNFAEQAGLKVISSHELKIP